MEPPPCRAGRAPGPGGAGALGRSRAGPGAASGAAPDPAQVRGAGSAQVRGAPARLRGAGPRGFKARKSPPAPFSRSELGEAAAGPGSPGVARQRTRPKVLPHLHGMAMAVRGSWQEHLETRMRKPGLLRRKMRRCGRMETAATKGWGRHRSRTGKTT
ncbi:uncharacterized protein ACIQIH_008603 isoform 2-T2 [Cyanocitta cristata]